MIPKTEIRYSRIYNKILGGGIYNKNAKFENIYKKNISNILKLIEKHHIKKWKYKLIPIYLVNSVNKKKMGGFSDPLTLKSRKDEKYMLVVLVHELLHNNMGNKKFSDPKSLHIYMEPIVDKVVEKLNLKLDKKLALFNERIRGSYE
jgi:hypothetical protein